MIGCPIKDRAWVLPDWFAALDPQITELREHYHVKVHLVFAYTKSSDDTLAILEAHWPSAILVDSGTGRSLTNIKGHVWGADDTYQYMAILRNTLLAQARATRVDYFFSLDSDIIIPENALTGLLSYAETHRGVIAPALNMAPRGLAWNTMQWKEPAHPGVAERREGAEQAGKADVVMAAMLLDRTAITQVLWQSHKQGEDVGFCLNAEEHNVDRWWVPEIKCEHRMFQY